MEQNLVKLKSQINIKQLFICEYLPISSLSNVFVLQVDVMFKALSECQILHPDPQDEEQGRLVKIE